jgi:predicted alpha/beta-hydrolase family hydrolase
MEREPLPQPVADFIFAHGAGAGKDSPFIISMTELLEARGIRVHRFNFEYMIKSLTYQKRRPPSKMPILCEDFIQQLNEIEKSRPKERPLFIGGKSMGSRVACEVVKQAQQPISGVIAYGYPFHPVKKPEKSRLETLTALTLPCLVIQGELDAFGSQEEVNNFDIPSNIAIKFVPTANHDLKPLKKSGCSEEQALKFAADNTLTFIQDVL